MRLQQYINESKSLEGLNTSDIIMLLFDKCYPFIKELTTPDFKYSDGFLYSGRNHNSMVFISKIRNDRRPFDTSIEVHNYADRLFYKKFGWKARSNSIFCIGDYNFAAEYGDNVYMIFPIGKYKYLWSPKVEDLYTEIGVAYNNLYKERLLKIIDTYQTINLKKAIKSTNEIMLNCDKYVAVRTLYEQSIVNYLHKYGSKKPTKETLKEFQF